MSPYCTANPLSRRAFARNARTSTRRGPGSIALGSPNSALSGHGTARDARMSFHRQRVSAPPFCGVTGVTRKAAVPSRSIGRDENRCKSLAGQEG